VARSSSARSAEKPCLKFPLWLHTGTGQWCQKICGKRHYFGRDADAGLKRYLTEKDDLEAASTLAGRPPQADGGDLFE